MAEVAALIGNPSRANMLAALMDGRALTATELAFIAGVSAATASEHLARLTEGRLLGLVCQGRHRYYRLASPQVGSMLESIMVVAAEGPPRHRPLSRIDTTLREARTCYDHLAGRIAVAVTDVLAARGQVALDVDGGMVTAAGLEFFHGFGVDPDKLRRGKRLFCRPCLDWSERRPHLAGSVGAALCDRYFQLGWIRRLRDTRAVEVTPDGWTGLQELFGILPRTPDR